MTRENKRLKYWCWIVSGSMLLGVQCGGKKAAKKNSGRAYSSAEQPHEDFPQQNISQNELGDTPAGPQQNISQNELGDTPASPPRIASPQQLNDFLGECKNFSFSSVDTNSSSGQPVAAPTTRQLCQYDRRRGTIEVKLGDGLEDLIVLAHQAQKYPTWKSLLEAVRWREGPSKQRALQIIAFQYWIKEQEMGLDTSPQKGEAQEGHYILLWKKLLAGLQHQHSKLGIAVKQKPSDFDVEAFLASHTDSIKDIRSSPKLLSSLCQTISENMVYDTVSDSTAFTVHLPQEILLSLLLLYK